MRRPIASRRFPTIKVLFLAAVAAIFTVVVGAVVLNRTPSYKILFSNISDRDGGQVAASLQQMNVPYQLGEGGTISVPSDKVYDARLKLAAQGLPKAGGVGFELMDNQKFGISQFAEQVNYQRAIEGELARTIEAVGSVERSHPYRHSQAERVRARAAAAHRLGDADPVSRSPAGRGSGGGHPASGLQLGAEFAGQERHHRRSGWQSLVQAGRAG